MLAEVDGSISTLGRALVYTLGGRPFFIMSGKHSRYFVCLHFFSAKVGMIVHKDFYQICHYNDCYTILKDGGYFTMQRMELICACDEKTAGLWVKKIHEMVGREVSCAWYKKHQGHVVPNFLCCQG